MNQKEYLISLQLEQGWQIIINTYNSLPIFENTLVFSAINRIRGKELYIEYENETIGYVLNEIIINRENFNFDFNENSKIYNIISSNLLLDSLLKDLNEKTNPDELDLIELKVFGGWEIIFNHFYKSEKKYDEKQFLFLARKNKHIIEVNYIKDNVYKISSGELKNINSNDLFNLRNIKSLKNYNFNDLKKLVNFLEDFFIKPC